MAGGGSTPPRGPNATPASPDSIVDSGAEHTRRIIPPLPEAAAETPMEQTAGGGRKPFLRRVQQVLNGDSAQAQTFVPGTGRDGSEEQMTTPNLDAVGAGGTIPRADLAGRVVVSTTQAPAAAYTPEAAAVQSRPVAPASRVAAEPAARAGQPRQARLRLKRVDPWSVFKTALLLSIAFGIVTIVSVLIVWSVLGAAGVWDSVNSTVQSVVGGQDGTSFQVEDYVGMQRVVGFTMLVSVIDVFLLTAIATLSAFLYNMAAALLGGLELTLVEDN